MTVQDIESDGACYGRVITALDITARKQVEKALKESEEKFSKAFNASSNSMCIISLKTGNIMDASESFLRFSGYSREEIIGHNAYALNIWENPEDQKLLERLITETGRFNNIEIQYRIKSGERRTCLTSGEMINIRGETDSVFTAVDYATALEALPFKDVRISGLDEVVSRLESPAGTENPPPEKRIISFEITVNK
jgi:PAS domain S-box-containing protein